MGRIGLPEVIFVAVVIVVFFRFKKLPGIFRVFAQSLKEFKKSLKEEDANGDVPPDDGKKQ